MLEQIPPYSSCSDLFTFNHAEQWMTALANGTKLGHTNFASYVEQIEFLMHAG